VLIFLDSVAKGKVVHIIPILVLLLRRLLVSRVRDDFSWRRLGHIYRTPLNILTLITISQEVPPAFVETFGAVFGAAAGAARAAGAALAAVGLAAPAPLSGAPLPPAGAALAGAGARAAAFARAAFAFASDFDFWIWS